ncbi:transcriptional activator srcap [Fusarium heterosporum]|uniref:Transcriptional activator srcap n=1 Tax=Fusarium heterosporum TaxID=42747 RepID=A0A8H5X3Q0_FUSHE|nr:transcriptional activator srcap [Fusarium heterosporum]
MDSNYNQGNPNPKNGDYFYGNFQGTHYQFPDGYPYQGYPQQPIYNYPYPTFNNMPIPSPSLGYTPMYNHNPYNGQQGYPGVNTLPGSQVAGQGGNQPNLNQKRAFDKNIPDGFENNLRKQFYREPVQTVSTHVVRDHVDIGVHLSKKVPELPLPTIPGTGQDQDTSRYEVDSYQIAVPNGDCSVHFLVDRSKAKKSNPRTFGCIVRSVLMDGGNDGGKTAVTAAGCLRSALDELRSWYTIMEATGPYQSQEYILDTIRFDAWVITHWDYDHWGGSLSMILADLQSQGVEKQSRFMKYNANGEPLTVLYCPNWTKVPDVFADLCAQESKPKDNEVKKRPNPLRIDNEPAVEGVGEGIVHVDLANGIVVQNLCVARWGPSMLIGRDFFTGERCWPSLSNGVDKLLSFKNALATTFGTFKTFTEVHTKVFGSPEQPRLFCVGAAGFLLGRRISAAALKQALGDMGGARGDTWANLSSIMTVLHFPGKPYISLYWAGDAVTSIERDLITIPLFGSKPFFDGYTVAVAKWSHHGSSHSSPAELWDTLKPKKFVVSANMTGRYEHPHRDVIERCYNYYKKQDPGLCSSSDRVYAMYFPGWIKSHKEKAERAKAYKAVKERAAKLKAEREQAEEQATGQSKTKKGKPSKADKQQDSFPEDPPSPTIADVHDWNMDNYEMMWDGLSPNIRGWIAHDLFLFGPKPNTTRLGWYRGDGSTLPRGSAKVLFLHVISSAIPDRDGAIHIFASYGNAFKAAKGKDSREICLGPWHNRSPQDRILAEADSLLNMNEAVRADTVLQPNGQSGIDWTRYPPTPVDPFYGDDLAEAIAAMDSFESGPDESLQYFEWYKRSQEGIDLLNT